MHAATTSDKLRTTNTYLKKKKNTNPGHMTSQVQKGESTRERRRGEAKKKEMLQSSPQDVYDVLIMHLAFRGGCFLDGTASPCNFGENSLEVL